MKRTLALLACAATIGLAGCADKATDQAGAATTTVGQLPSVSRLTVAKPTNPSGLTLTPALEADSVKLADPTVGCKGMGSLCGAGAPTAIILARVTDANGTLLDANAKDLLVEVLEWSGIDCASVAHPPPGMTPTFKAPCTRHTLVNAQTGDIEGSWIDN